MKRRRGAQRAKDQARPLGRDIRLARTTAGVTRADAATRAGVSRSTWDRVEAGDSTVTLTTLCAVTDAIGLDLVVRAHPGRGTSLRDRGQMAIAQHAAKGRRR
ncbi:MAG: helix-turn-helix domain-containing protein [Chloroflexota bacterium]|nr:helix-turn-helix domain-containing protein [Chloroflexota bacterium]